MKVLLIFPSEGGRIPPGFDIADAVLEAGFELEVFDYSKHFPKYMEIADQVKDIGRPRSLACIILNKKLLELADRFRPDLVLDLGPVSTLVTEEFKKKGAITCFWLLEDAYLPIFRYWKEVVHSYDFFFPINPGPFLDDVRALGVKNFKYLPMGCNPKAHKKIKLSKREREIYSKDVSFFGTCAWPNREKVFSRLKGRYDFMIWGKWLEVVEKGELLDVIKGGRRWVSHDIAVKVYNATKINLNLHGSYDTLIGKFPGGTANPRTFMIQACGGFQLVDRREAIPPLFEEGREIECYGSVEELCEKIDYYLLHPKERQEIARAGRARALRDHTYKQRLLEMVDFIKERYKV